MASGEQDRFLESKGALPQWKGGGWACVPLRPPCAKHSTGCFRSGKTNKVNSALKKGIRKAEIRESGRKGFRKLFHL